MPPAEIIIMNDSGEDLVLVHTSLANEGATSAYGGKPSYWKTVPPDAGTKIEPGKSLSVGVIDSVVYWDSPSWIFLQYQGTDKIILQVFVDMMGPGVNLGKGIWANVGPYDPSSTEDAPMPNGKRMELIVYDLGKEPNSLVTVHIPPVESWTYLVPPPPPPPDNTGEVVMSLLNVALSTLITVCFVIPPAAEIGVALEPMSTAGKAAVAMTAAQGVLGVVTAPSHSSIPPAFGPKQAYAANKLTQKEWTQSKLRLLMDGKQAGFRHENDHGGIEARLRSVATRVRKQLETSTTVNFEGDLLEDTKQCLDFFKSITEEDTPFQRALLPCLDLKPSTDAPAAPPDKLKLALGFAGLSMTLGAFSNGYALRSFVRAASNAKELEEQLQLSHFDADHVYVYFRKMITLIRDFDLERMATAQRLSLIIYGLEIESHPAESVPVIYEVLSVTDNGIQNATWGSGTVEKADVLMKELGLDPNGKYSDHGPRKWRATNPYGGRGARSDFAYNVYNKYSKAVSEDVSADVKKARDDTIAEIEDSLIPYIADLRTPLAPFRSNMQVKVVHAPAQGNPDKLELGLVQYGYSYLNARGIESEIYWHQPVPLLLDVTASGEKRVPSGATVTVPKDPNNLKAEQLALKAKPIDEAAKQLAPIEPTSKTKTLKALPTYVSAFRQVYRRFWTNDDQVKTGQPAVVQAIVKKLGNLEGEEFSDSWDSKLVVTGKV